MKRPLLALSCALAVVLPALFLPSAARSGSDFALKQDDFARRVLDTHNRERLRIGMRPLRWSAGLSEDARRWAASLASREALEHSWDNDAGENLWMGTSNAYTPEDMIGSFISERHAYRGGRFPGVSRTGNWADVGHYTQVIWPDTREVGCALARGRRNDILVCRYWPAGNVEGERMPFAETFATSRFRK